MFCPQRNRLNCTSRTQYRRDPPALNLLVGCVIGLSLSFKVDNKNLLSAASEGLRVRIEVVNVIRSFGRGSGRDRPLHVAWRDGCLVGVVP